MLPKIKKTEWAKLQQKHILYIQTIKPDTKQGNPALWAELQRYAKLVLRRHGVSEKTHQVNMQTGDIVERKKE